MGDRGVGIAQVVGDCWLAIGSGGDHAVAALVAEHNARVEACNEVVALVFERDGGHSQPDVLGEQAEHGLDVACLEGSGEPVDEVVFGG